MAMAMVRGAGLRTALRGGSRSVAPPKRSFSSSAGHNDAREADKWEKITYLGIAACTILTFVNLSKPHPHHEPPPPYPYLHIRNKEFPWGGGGGCPVVDGRHSVLMLNR
ncbi:cytochrome c oxidase subunit 6a [Pyrus ussuriensis x Pyrus communis]|uniref:Cytochrome c oxidase subunit 6a n=1 Tax=Pyrus ussuriensis x Pyrus communis TaxID=2448454 RepID=A0A5N5GR92_9ROSA|nr:cytochrome c oxidase subunit 6a, mitochondrial isoform X1 [Pyrus x bretschneideri]KAB2617657.1 cytochrome c oxidase subunit 6a [Pyrus ussuriensis x Pyrus communis]